MARSSIAANGQPDRGEPIAKHGFAVVWVVLGPVNFKTIGLKQCISRVAELLGSQASDINLQISADSRKMVVAKMPQHQPKT